MRSRGCLMSLVGEQSLDERRLSAMSVPDQVSYVLSSRLLTDGQIAIVLHLYPRQETDSDFDPDDVPASRSGRSTA